MLVHSVTVVLHLRIHLLQATKKRVEGRPVLRILWGGEGGEGRGGEREGEGRGKGRGEVGVVHLAQ